DMGEHDKSAKYFVYECDEFDRNFLAFNPHLSLVTGVSWDHHEIFPTREDYQAAFVEFVEQSGQTFIWRDDASYLDLHNQTGVTVLNPNNPDIQDITLAGLYTRLDAWLVIEAIHA